MTRPNAGGLMTAIAICLLALDHNWTNLTWGALAIAAGVLAHGRLRELTTRKVTARVVPTELRRRP